jgi:hypothetical protein
MNLAEQSVGFPRTRKRGAQCMARPCPMAKEHDMM